MNSKTFDFYWTQRIIDLLIKLSGVVVTSFATLSVAHEAFSHIEQPWLNVIKIGALILVEGAFIISWLAIDSQKNAPMPMKIAWAITLIVIYIALLVIALANGEGSAGWAFRFVLAVMIGRSIYEAGIYEVLRQAQRADRDIRSSVAVRRLARQLAKEDAITALNMESAQANYARELNVEVSRARIESEHETAMIDVGLFRERLLSGIHARDHLARKQFQVKMQHESKQLEQQMSVKTTRKAIPRVSQKRVDSLMQEQSEIEVKLKSMLLTRLRENPNRSFSTLCKLVKASSKTVQKYLHELSQEGKLLPTTETRSGYVLANG